MSVPASIQPWAIRLSPTHARHSRTPASHSRESGNPSLSATSGVPEVQGFLPSRRLCIDRGVDNRMTLLAKGALLAVSTPHLVT